MVNLHLNLMPLCYMLSKKYMFFFHLSYHSHIMWVMTSVHPKTRNPKASLFLAIKECREDQTQRSHSKNNCGVKEWINEEILIYQNQENNYILLVFREPPSYVTKNRSLLSLPQTFCCVNTINADTDMQINEGKQFIELIFGVDVISSTPLEQLHQIINSLPPRACRKII